jgi:hypothetical protein
VKVSEANGLAGIDYYFLLSSNLPFLVFTKTYKVALASTDSDLFTELNTLDSILNLSAFEQLLDRGLFRIHLEQRFVILVDVINIHSRHRDVGILFWPIALSNLDDSLDAELLHKNTQSCT